jgi:2-phospho-L-lactate guanylyltransferase
MALVRELYEHVCAMLLDTGLRVVTLSPTAIDVPAAVELWRDEASGLNGAVRAALRRLDPPVLVVHADLPRLATDDIDRVLGGEADVVVARAHDGGTNGLLLRRMLTTAFGPGSALVHAHRARAAGLSVSVVDTSGFAFDVDDESALSAYGAFSSLGKRL